VADLPGAALQRAALAGMAFHDARLALHTDPVYAPANPILWSFLNSDRRGGFCEASMWLASVVEAPPAAAARLWKSWITHRARPQQVVHEATFTHLLPTPATLQAQESLNALQGLDGLWFAGGYLHPYDSQETALVSALRVALGLQAASERGRLLTAASACKSHAPTP
jgi:predicted NAD/FAD-binding protein